MKLNPAEHLSRSGDPFTSSEAAESLSDSREIMAKKLLLAFINNPGGLTAEEAATASGYSAENGAWKRVSDLRNAGYIKPKVIDGQEVTRVGTSNRKQRVLVAVQTENL